MSSKDLSLKTPNSEQEEAIRHEGGVLLSAGAGSGKTFVLVEHIVHLFELFYRQNKELSQEDFRQKLRERFSEIVMMTFTKKAAGELSLRLQARFELGRNRAVELEEGDIPIQCWDMANELVDSIFVGTIHSFCYRLISQGLVPGFSGNEDMISEPELKNKLNGLFDTWLEENIEFLKAEELEHVLINKVFYRNHLLKIFSDTDLRVLWSSYSKKNDDDIEKRFESIFPLFCGSSWKNFQFESSIYNPEDKKTPAWFKFLETFSNATTSCKSFTEFCEASNIVFNSLSRMPAAPRKQGLEGAKKIISGLKLVREFTKNYWPDFEAAIENPLHFKKNEELVLKIYSSLENQYFSTPGLTFTDLEFFVWKALAGNESACREVEKNYSYFIIDEFQDTSNVQFSIVKSIVARNMKKVFCVGDVKQAIYGFRGGELGVFQEAKESIYKNLSLKNNYRSSDRVISFNNQLFEHVLPLGENYSGNDNFSVPMLKQSVPDFRLGSGSLKKVSIKITGEMDDGSKSLKPTALNYIEAIEISKLIANRLDDNFCILYRKLTPTRFLIPALKDRDIGFTCQVKIQLEQDPILALFCEYSRMLSFAEYEEEFRLSLLVVNQILDFLSCRIAEDTLNDLLEASLQEAGTFGLLDSFKRFIWGIGFSSTNLDHAWPLLEVLCDISLNDPERTYEMLGLYKDGNYSIDFKFGESADRVIIMTAHSSKGLEFDNVILGGIHTNGVDKLDGDLLGKSPSSYKWFAGKRKSEIYRSPAYIEEQEIKRLKAFSESKRLFYVAATRAVNSLIWLDISFNEKPASFSKSSWINALRSWECVAGEENTLLQEHIKESINDEQRSLEIYDLSNNRLDLATPIFQGNSLGVQWSDEEAPMLGSSAELSVTKLATLEQCARKFHLKNVLKLDVEVSGDDNLMEKTSDADGEAEDVFDSATFKSSANRGTAVHEILESLIKRNFILPRILEVDDQALQGINWVSAQLKEKYFSENYEFISEKQLKFSIFGQMISGTPDLIVKSLSDSVETEIWDYKTGRYHEDKCGPYWFQLYCYALSRGYEPEKKVSLILAFIDDQKIVSKTLSISEVTDRLFASWQKLSTPDKINQDHCSYCEYRGLCFPSR